MATREAGRRYVACSHRWPTDYIRLQFHCLHAAAAPVSIRTSCLLPCFLDSLKGPERRAAVWHGPTRKQTRAKATRGRPLGGVWVVHIVCPLTVPSYSFTIVGMRRPCFHAGLSALSLTVSLPFSICLWPSSSLTSTLLLPISPSLLHSLLFLFSFPLPHSSLLYIPSLLPFHIVSLFSVINWQ